MHQDALANGPITNVLAIIGVVSLIYWAWRIFAALTKPARVEAPPAPAPTPRAPVVTAQDDIAAISAAVYAVVGAHRIVHLEAEGSEHNWAAEGRWMHQTSHRPHA